MKFTKANHHTFDNDVIITSKELRSGINTVLITYIYILKSSRKEKKKQKEEPGKGICLNPTKAKWGEQLK